MSEPPELIAPEQPASTMRRDIISSYAASAARVASVALISALLLRRTHTNYFAAFILVRSVVGLCNYFFAGIAPAVQRSMAVSVAARSTPTIEPQSEGILNYATPQHTRSIEGLIYSNALLLGALSAVVCAALFAFYPSNFAMQRSILTRYWVLDDFLLWFFVGQVLRSYSEIPGATLQVRRGIGLDNCLIVAGELVWVAGAWASVSQSYAFTFQGVAAWYGVSGLGLLIARLVVARMIAPRERIADFSVSWRIMTELLGFGSLVVLGQLADFLYGPFATLLIQVTLGARAVADYAPALQVDAALLLSVGAIASVLLPKTALAHAAGNSALVQRYYLRGTLVSAAVLLAGGVTIWILSPWIFKLWLGDDMPATRAILPLVLIHTIIGGSSAVGRSILLGMGKAKPFAIAALLAGAANVILAIIFVKYLGLGLRGVVLATIIVVVARCALWMPWYILRSLRHAPGN